MAFNLEGVNFALRWHENGNEMQRMKTKRFAMAMMMSMALVSFGLRAQAQEAYSSTPPDSNPLGIGLQFGAPLGLTAKYFMNDTVAADGTIAWSPFSHSTAQIQADILLHDFDVVKLPGGKTPVYVGVGLFGRFRDDGRSNLGGVRVPFGISYMFNSAPLDFYAEVAPEFIFAPFARLSFDAAIGFHIWF